MRQILDDVACSRLKCPMYNDLRRRYIHQNFVNEPNLYKFNALMSSTCDDTIKNLALYVYHAMNERDVFLNVFQ